MEGGDAGFESEAFDDGGGATGLHVEVGQEAGMALAFEALDEAKHGTVRGDHLVTGMLTEGGEDIGEGGVLEVLGDNVEFDVAKTPDEADELEVTEVRGDPDRTGFAGLIFSGGVVELDFDMGLPVGAGEAACPKEVDESAGEVLVGAASDLRALFWGVLITEGNAKIFEGGPAAARVEPIG